MAAGLGGGSSDAAAALWGLSQLWRLRWPKARLQELAVELGMDVPFFLGTGRAVARGRGERLTTLPGGGGYALVLVNPRVPLSTREVYGRVPAGWRAEATGTERVIEALRTRNVNTVAAALTNNLESVVEPVLPVIGAHEGGPLGGGSTWSDHVRQRTDRVRDGALPGPRAADPDAGEPGGLGLLGGPYELRARDPRHEDDHDGQVPWGVVQW